MGEAGHNAGFPLFSKPARGKTAKHLCKITKDLVETTKDLGKTIRHLVFPGCYLALWQALWRMTKRAIKRPFHIVYIKVLGGGASEGPLRRAAIGCGLGHVPQHTPRRTVRAALQLDPSDAPSRV